MWVWLYEQMLHKMWNDMNESFIPNGLIKKFHPMAKYTYNSTIYIFHFVLVCMFLIWFWSDFGLLLLDLPILLLMAVQDRNLQQFPQMSVPSAVKVNWLFNYSGLASVQLVWKQTGYSKAQFNPKTQIILLM